jgi:carboxyl-terminal processing protease
MAFWETTSRFNRVCHLLMVVVVPSILGVLVGLTVMLSACSPQRTPEQQKAIALYDDVWRLVYDHYLDPSLNHQDWSRWRHRYDEKLNTMDDAYVAIHTMLISLNDEYTRLLTPKVAAEQDMQITSRLFGVGIQLGQVDGKTLVIACIEDSPAERAKIMPKDQILKVDNLSVEDLKIDEIVSHIRGPKGTKVVLTILRDGRPRDIALIRDEIRLKSVTYKTLPKRIGYLRLSTFISQDAMDEVTAALEKARQESDALIIDLRGNTGGLLPNALEMADMFLDKGLIVSVVNRDGQRQEYESDPALSYNGPIALLIDTGSASASEIFSGALKDNKRAVLLGETSFGKGLVQRINNMSDGSEINMTIAKYLTPSGQDIHKKGIQPDIAIPLTRADVLAHRDKVLDRAVVELERRRKSSALSKVTLSVQVR